MSVQVCVCACVRENSYNFVSTLSFEIIPLLCRPRFFRVVLSSGAVVHSGPLLVDSLKSNIKTNFNRGSTTALALSLLQNVTVLSPPKSSLSRSLKPSRYCTTRVSYNDCRPVQFYLLCKCYREDMPDRLVVIAISNIPRRKSLYN